jgi:hypothetical protein
MDLGESNLMLLFFSPIEALEEHIVRGCLQEDITSLFLKFKDEGE